MLLHHEGRPTIAVTEGAVLEGAPEEEFLPTICITVSTSVFNLISCLSLCVRTQVQPLKYIYQTPDCSLYKPYELYLVYRNLTLKCC